MQAKLICSVHTCTMRKWIQFKGLHKLACTKANFLTAHVWVRFMLVLLKMQKVKVASALGELTKMGDSVGDPGTQREQWASEGKKSRWRQCRGNGMKEMCPRPHETPTSCQHCYSARNIQLCLHWRWFHTASTIRRGKFKKKMKFAQIRKPFIAVGPPKKNGTTLIERLETCVYSSVQYYTTLGKF